MKSLYKKIFFICQIPIDIALSIIAIPAAIILLFYRRIGSARFPITTRRLQKIGLFPIYDRYYKPLFKTHRLKPLSQDRSLPGINLNIPAQLQFLKKMLYNSELNKLELNQPVHNHYQFSMLNGSFAAGDADYLYQFIRTTKPRKIIEIGSGNSTKIAKLALNQNRQEGKVTQHICIEPYEQPWLEQLGEIEVIRKCVEDCELDWARSLQSGDLLFIDSSHIIRPQGDVLKEYLEILPVLASGVYVHIHDIFTPKDYLDAVVIKDVRFWNEQYLLEALLSGSNRYEIIGALNFLKHHHYDELKTVCPYITPEREPGSFYLRVL